MNVEWTEDAYDRLADIAVTLSLPDQHELERAVGGINAATCGEFAGVGGITR